MWEFTREKMIMGEPLKKGNAWIPSLCGTAMLPSRPANQWTLIKTLDLSL